MLYNINYFLSHMREVSGVSEATLDHYEGVGRFWRAWFYYDMVQEFENVPWYEHEIKSNDQEALYKTQDSRAFVMEKVLEDISFAAEKLLNGKTSIGPVARKSTDMSLSP